MSKKKKVILAVSAVAVIIAVFLISRGSAELREYRKIISSMEINDVVLSQVPDGVYSGSSDAVLVSAEVKVTVKDHKIIDVELVRHDHGRGEAAEVIPQKILDAQSLDVEMVTGATSSCKVILKAAENALRSGIK